MAMATAGTPPTLALPVPLEIRAGATARRLPQTVSRVRYPAGNFAISKTCSGFEPSIRFERARTTFLELRAFASERPELADQELRAMQGFSSLLIEMDSPEEAVGTRTSRAANAAGSSQRSVRSLQAPRASPRPKTG